MGGLGLFFSGAGILWFASLYEERQDRDPR